MTNADQQAVLVWWCGPSEVYLPYEGEKRVSCPMDYCLESSVGHLMRKRRMWICPGCPEENNGFLTKMEHNHDHE